MKSTAFNALISVGILLLPHVARADVNSLDLRYQDIRLYGSLTGFCYANPNVSECRVGIGEWKPHALERIKASSIQCFERCPADTYGFVRSVHGQRDYPEIHTKDFDGSAPSRGVEFRLYPLSIEILRYEGCIGCSLIKETPKNVYLNNQGVTVTLPMLGYGTFYIPRPARKLFLNAAQNQQALQASLVFTKNSEQRMLSAASVAEYARMLKELKYSELN
jgi:hypothetical protein